MFQHIDHFVRSCAACHASGKSAKSESVHVQAVPHPDGPFHRIGIGLVGPFFTAPHGERLIIVIEDYFSKYPAIFLIGDTTSEKIISWLEDLFNAYGNPDTLLSDNGPQFVSSQFEDFLEERHIRLLKSPVYNPQTNVLIEVFNRSLKFGAQVIKAEGKPFSKGMLDLLE